MKTRAIHGDWSSLYCRTTKTGVVVSNESRIQGDITGMQILFKGRGIPKDDEELFCLWELRNTGRLLNKGQKVF